MFDYLFHLWAWLVAFLLIGAAAGWFIRRAPRGRVSRWLIWAGLAFGLGLFAAALGVLRGVAGALLESGLAAFALFMLGAAGAAYAAERSWRRHEGWALGLLPVALIWLGAAVVGAPDYERLLQRRAAALVTKAGGDPAGVTVQGRDLRPSHTLARNVALIDDLAALRGVRKIVLDEADDETVAAHAEKQHSVDGSRVDLPAQASRRPTEPGALLAALGDGPLELADCGAALDATIALDPITFREKSAAIRRDVMPALDKAAALIRRCPDVAVEVIGRADHVGGEEANSALSLRRAEAAARYLRREGVGGRRLIIVGYGENGGANRAQDRSVSFAVKPTM